MRTDHALFPMLMAALAVASLALMDAYMKSAALAVGALSAAWLRSLIATGIALPLWLARGGGCGARLLFRAVRCSLTSRRCGALMLVSAVQQLRPWNLLQVVVLGSHTVLID